MNQTKILVVEDYSSLRQMIEALLRTEGYLVQSAANGVEALAAMETTRPDLIVADIMMPQMDGYELFAAVRARREWVTIPFIFLTAKAEKADVLKGKELGAEDYITKPFEPEELLVAVRARLNRSRAIQQANESGLEELKELIIKVLSHELRTPLTSVLGYTELALEDLQTLPTEALQQFLAGIQRGAMHLWRLTEDLLLLTRLEGHVAAKEFAQAAFICHDLLAEVEAVVEQFQAQAQKRGVKLVLEAAPVRTPVKLHAAFFADALGRLLDNAIKFSPADQARQVTVRLQPTLAGVEIAVQDQGCGIAEADLAHLFERFRQIDRIRREQQGVGIGLAIAQGLIRLHGGEIRVTSQPGQGSVFTICLPAIAEGKE